MSDYEDGFGDGYDWAKIAVNAFDEDSMLSPLQMGIITAALEYGDHNKDFRNAVLATWREEE